MSRVSLAKTSAAIGVALRYKSVKRIANTVEGYIAARVSHAPGGAIAPIFLGPPFVCPYRLTYSDQIQHGHPCGEGRISRESPRPHIRGLAAMLPNFGGPHRFGPKVRHLGKTHVFTIDHASAI